MDPAPPMVSYRRVSTVLALDALMPFDVILTRPRGVPSSKGIALLTAGRYSHAALVIDGCVRFESVGRGVGFSASSDNLVVRTKGHRRVVEDVSKYSHVAVFRHPEIARLTNQKRTDLRDRMMTALARYNYLAYPPLSGFTGIVKEAEGALRVSRLLERLPRPTELDGPFCSELVAEVFAAFGYALFDDELPSNRVTPNALARSRLQSVPGVVFRALPPIRLSDIRACRAARRATTPIVANFATYAPRQETFHNLIRFIAVYKKEADVAYARNVSFACSDLLVSRDVNDLVRWLAIASGRRDRPSTRQAGTSRLRRFSALIHLQATSSRARTSRVRALSLLQEHARELSRDISLMIAAEDAIRTALDRLRAHDLAVARGAIAAYDGVLRGVQENVRFDWSPSPETMLAEHLRNQPNIAYFTETIEGYLDRYSLGWRDMTVPPPYSKIRKRAIELARRWKPSLLCLLE